MFGELALCVVPIIVLSLIALFGKFLALILVTTKDKLGNEIVVATGEAVCETTLDAEIATIALEQTVDSQVVHYPGEVVRAKYGKIYGENG